MCIPELCDVMVTDDRWMGFFTFIDYYEFLKVALEELTCQSLFKKELK